MSRITSSTAALSIIGSLALSGCSETEPAAEKADEMKAADRFAIALREAPETVVPLFEARSYGDVDSDTLRYRLLPPRDYDPGKEYPLVVCLAGVGARGADNVKQVAGSWAAQVLAKPENRERYPCFVLVPQCPAKKNWGFSVQESVMAKWQKQTTLPVPEGVSSSVFALIEQLQSEFSIDRDRTYITGQSMGGYGTWHFIISRPDLFAAAVPVAGGADPALAETIAHLPVWAFHGEKDVAVPVAYSRDIVEALRKAGGNPRYTEYPGERHVVWPLAFDNPELLDWIFAQKRGGSEGG